MPPEEQSVNGIEGYARLMVSLDALLDTRASLIARMAPEHLDEIMTSGYHERLVDEFPRIDVEEFKKLYEARDASLLANSMVTPIWRRIHQFTKQTALALASGAFKRIPVIVINVHPYILSDIQQATIAKAVDYYTESMAEVEFTSMSYEEIGPKFLADNFIEVIFYDYWKWLDANFLNSKFDTEICPQIRMIGPSLVQSTQALRLLENLDYTEAIESHFRAYVKLELIPPYMFSVDMRRIVDGVKEEKDGQK